ncbi:Hypothetical predicted protein [Podarcis lilfordi]|uniref:Uncharacterized protein n=1 Tax=Podarcis lilfordi TaxID=74358 RepID=A0AA35P3T6_9SAUR|nr:Hypothetical predicted protein [Podarcis lilfordi]
MDFGTALQLYGILDPVGKDFVFHPMCLKMQFFLCASLEKAIERTQRDNVLAEQESSSELQKSLFSN